MELFKIEVEKSLLGCILEDNTICNHIETENIFYSTKNKLIFETIKKYIKEYNGIDYTILEETLKGKVDINYLIEVATGNDGLWNVYIEELENLYYKRVIKKTCNIIDWEQNAEDIKSDILNGINVITTKKKEEDLSDTVFRALESIITPKQGLKVGFRIIDNICSGLHGGELISIVARSGVGKTTLALNMTYNLLRMNRKVSYYSLEMPKEEMIKKLLCISTQVPFWKTRKGVLNDEELEKVVKASNGLATKKLKVYDEYFTIEKIVNKIKSDYLEGHIEIAFIDLINRVKIKGNGSRAEIIGEGTRALKQLALELNIPIVILAQINRVADSREDKRPTIADVKESGSIEEDSDLVIGVYRNLTINNDITVQANNIELDYSSNDANKNPERAELIIMKSRYSGSATSSVKYVGETGTMNDLMR